MFDNINFITHQFKDRNVYLQNKYLMLCKQWDNLATWFLEQAAARENERAKDVAVAIGEIPDRVRDYVLRQYLRQLQFLIGIFFYMKRRLLQSDVCDPVECQMQIQNLQRHLIKNLTVARTTPLLTKDTAKKSELDN